MAEGTLSMVVGIATTGRKALLTRVVDDLRRQTRKPDQVIVCPARTEDIDPDALAAIAGLRIRIVHAAPGLTRQRNAILRAAAPHDVIVFFDDDFVLHDAYLAEMEKVLVTRPELSVMTGRVLADGIHGPGLSIDDAHALLAAATIDARASTHETYGAYGCNMAFRLRDIAACGACFDERLPLYGWQEDIDFSRQLAGRGAIVRCDASVGVHLGTKAGRQSGVRFGYSQIANPVYLHAKGTMHARYALRLMARNVAANIGRLAYPEAHVDRAGRAKGNVLALLDLLRGRLQPERVLEL